MGETRPVLLCLGLPPQSPEHCLSPDVPLSECVLSAWADSSEKDPAPQCLFPREVPSVSGMAVTRCPSQTWP